MGRYSQEVLFGRDLCGPLLILLNLLIGLAAIRLLNSASQSIPSRGPTPLSSLLSFGMADAVVLQVCGRFVLIIMLQEHSQA